MRVHTFACPVCKRIFKTDYDGAIPAHNIKGKKDNTLANLCAGSHKLSYLTKGTK